MSFFFNVLQIVGWIGVGFNIHANNNWAVFGCVMFSFAMSLISAMDMVGKQLREHGNSSK